MRPEKLALDLKSNTRFTQTILQKFRTNEYGGVGIGDGDIADDCIGGVIRDGQFGWIAVGAHLEVYSLKTGTKVASYSFDSSQRLSNTVITCVTEIQTDGINSCILIVGVQCSPIGGLLYVFSVQGSRVIHRIDVIDKVTSCCYVNTIACRQSALKIFDGCVAIGTDNGKVLLMDLNLTRCKEIIYRRHVYNSDVEPSTCRIILADEYTLYEDIIDEYRRAKRERINFGIQLEVLDKPTAIVSILSLTPLLTIAVGLEDGRMVLYSLNNLAPFHLAHPPELNAPLTKLTFLEPADDPRACVYIWAFHSSSRAAIAVMHSIAFETKTIQDDECLYEKFQSCSPRLTIPICQKRSIPVACQSISKVVCDEEDELLSLCLLGWTSKGAGTKMLLFDLNQWYKEQMPDLCDWQEYPSYLAPFPIEGVDVPLDIWLNPKSVATFNSIQRPEEHFYPTSLSFDCVKLTVSSVYRHHWPGLQNKALQRLNAMGAAAILEPDECFTDILETNLFPQLSEHNYHANPSTRIKQEFLLSMALEYNCMGLLKECARQWCDGSHMGNRPYDDGLTLSTLTDWIWSQATEIKDCCNNLCVPLFDHSGITIDLRSRKILAHCSRQLKLLADLLDMIVNNCRQYIPDEIFDTLCCQRNSIRMTNEYQEVLQWLLNMGLLPEIAWNQFSRHNSQISLPCTPDMLAAEDAFAPVPYPYRILNEYYTAQRQKFYEIDRSFITPKTKSCRCLYIDAFIERECNSPHLRAEWENSHGDALYPPPSLQAMLRVLLVPGISLESKYALFIYLFLDLNMVLEDDRYVRVVRNLIKFPAVFKLNSTIIKTTQAFWNLDHKEYETAIDELISPLTNDRFISTWQQELLVHTLLVQDMPNLALRALRAPGPSIRTELEIKTLLANNLITEAFELQRTKYDENLLLEFYKGCHHLKKWNYVLGLALTEREGQVLLKFLRSNESLLSENLQLLYLLQRNKYVEALTYLDGLKYRQRPAAFQRQLDNTQGTIFSAFKMGMVPSDRKLSDLFLSIKDHVGTKKASPAVSRGVKDDGAKPFSSFLNTGEIDSNANIIGDFFHRAILSAKSTSASIAATADDDNSDDGMQGYVPFLSKPSIDFDYFECNSNKTVTYPTPYLGTAKRRKEIEYENNRERDSQQPAAKRQRTTEPTPLLLRTLARGLINDSHNGDGELDETVNLLSTPVVKSSRMEKHATNQSSRCQTPQSILKHRHAESEASRRSVSPTLTVNSARRSVDFDERSFRFGAMQSTTANSSAEEYRLSAIPETGADAETEHNSPYGEIKARMPLHVPDTSALSMSADEYFSPENTELSERSYDIREEREASQEIHREFEEMSDYSNNSEKAKEIEAKPVAEKTTRRSKSREPITSLPSTRLTRSKSKLNLEVDSVDGMSKISETSTPLRKIRGRMPLSKAVIEANASKYLAERNKTSDEATTSTSTPHSTSTGDDETYPNILDDNSDINDSLMQKYLGNKSVYSDVSTAYTPNVHSRGNILEDSSVQDIFDRSEAPSTNDEQQKEFTAEADAPEPMDTNDSDQIVEVITIVETTEEPSNVEEQPSTDADLIEKDSADAPLTKVAAQVEESEKIEESENIDPTAQIEPSTSNAAAESVANILTDNSTVTESFIKRFAQAENSIVYSETSTFFHSSTHVTNILDESSFGPTLAQHSIKEVADELPMELFQPQSSSDVEDNDEDDRGKDEKKYASDVEDINYDSTSSSSVSEQTTSSNDSSASSYQSDEIVINISSSSESSVPSNQFHIVTHNDDEIAEENFAVAAVEFIRPDPPLGSHAIYALPDDDQPPSTDDYIITEMFSTPMDEMPDSSADLLPTQSINDIVYGDLDDIGMSDSANEDDIYVREAISVETQPQDNLLEPIDVTTQAEAETVSETLSTDTLDRGFVDGGETLGNIGTETKNMDANDDEITTTEHVVVGELNVDFESNEATIQEKENLSEDATYATEETNIFEKAIIAEQTDSGVVDRTATDENMSESSASKTLVDEEPSTSGVPSKKRRRSVSVNSSISTQSVIKTVNLPSKRSTRAKSVASDSVPAPTTPKLRLRRAVSQQNLNEIPEMSPAQSKLRRPSSTLDSIVELPKTPSTRRRKASESSEIEITSNRPVKEQQQLPKTPRRSLRSRGSDADSVTSTPSSHRQSVDRESISTTPSTRSRRRILRPQHESPSEPETEVKSTKEKATPSKRTRSKRLSSRDDDEVSETSSIASSLRSSSSLQTPATEIDDDNVSMKSTRSSKRTRPTSTLPPIDEDTATPSKTSIDYMAASRLTRAQKANLEKYSTKQRQPETPTTPKTPKTPRRVVARRQSTMDSMPDADEDNNSDSKSIASDTSKISKTSMASRSSKRLRAKK